MKKPSTRSRRGGNGDACTSGTFSSVRCRPNRGGEARGLTPLRTPLPQASSLALIVIHWKPETKPLSLDTDLPQRSTFSISFFFFFFFLFLFWCHEAGMFKWRSSGSETWFCDRVSIDRLVIQHPSGGWQLAAFDRGSHRFVFQTTAGALARSKCSRAWTGHVWLFNEVERREGGADISFLSFRTNSRGAERLSDIRCGWCSVEVTDSPVEMYEGFARSSSLVFTTSRRCVVFVLGWNYFVFITDSSLADFNGSCFYFRGTRLVHQERKKNERDSSRLFFSF